MFTWEGDFSKIVLWLQRGLDFSGSVGAGWEQTSTKNQSKNGVQDGMHLGIDFLAILVDFGCQVGVKNRPKIDQKWHRKTMRKRRATRVPKKLQ